MRKAIRISLSLCVLLVVLSGCSYLLNTNLLALPGAAQDLHIKGETVTISKQEYEALLRFAKSSEILDIIDEYYYIDTDIDEMLTGAERGLLYALEDPYTFYYSPDEFQRMWEDDAGEYAGIGIQILTSTETLLCSVSRVFKDTPAERAGVLKGDTLVMVDDLAVDAYTLQEAVDIMRGKVGEPVALTVQRGDERLEFIINRAIVRINRVEYKMLNNNIGYVVLYEFAGDCFEAFSKAVNEMIDRGAVGLILDLRDNPGGWINDAEAIADFFMDRGIVHYLQYRDGQREYAYTKNGSVDIELVVLMNEHSASSSEILAGALQDRERATIIGTQSFGKGVVQHVIPVGNDGSGIQFTAAQYFTPNGNVVHGVGITPDVVVELPQEDTNRLFEFGDMSDLQLKAAYEFLVAGE
ncbi:MAG: S41 family peptidase [Clostridia bacterium]|nr:S41 family peptidase [Clostridia bacterium]